MADGFKVTVTPTDIKAPWNQPGTNKFYFQMAVEEYGEPIRFIQDVDKDAPEPEVGKSYEGMIYEDPKGAKFYPNKPNKGRGAAPQRSSAPSAPASSGAQGTAVDTPSYVGSDYMKDVSDLPDRMIQRLLPYYDVQTLVKDGQPTPQFTQMMETAACLSDESLRMIENVRTGRTILPKSDATPPSAGVATGKQSLADAWGKATGTKAKEVDPGPGDDDAPAEDN